MAKTRTAKTKRSGAAAKIAPGAWLWQTAERLAQRYSPATVALGTALVLLCAIIAARLLQAWRAAPPDSAAYSFTYETGPLAATPLVRARTARATEAGPALDDPATRYAERLREASALALGLALAAFAERLSARRLPASLPALVAAAEQRGLLPPNARWEAGPLRFGGAWGRYFVRYRTGRLGLEVLAVGYRGAADGEVFLLRVPDDGGQVQAPEDTGPRRSWAGLWVADSGVAVLPPPFVPAARLPALGWHAESLRPGTTNPQRRADLLAWLQQSAPAPTGTGGTN